MSKGGGGGTQTVSQRTELPGWVNEWALANKDLAVQTSQNLMRPQDSIAPMTNEGKNVIQNLYNNIGTFQPGFDQAQAMAMRASNYTPQTVAAGQVNPAMVGAPARIGADQVSAGSLAETDLNPYMNPYTQNVIGAGMQAIDTQRMQALNGNADAAIRNNAFGGSRHGVTEGITNAGAATAAGKLASDLQQQNFLNAQGQATADINRNFAAQGANQGANLQAGQFNSQQGLQAGLANQNASNQGQQFNVSAALQAALANQNAGLAGANLGLDAAKAYGGLTGAAQQSYLGGNAAALAGQEAVHAQNQAYQSALKNYPLEQLQIQMGALGNSPYGQTQTSTGPGQSSNGFLQGLGGAAAIAGIGGSLFGGGGMFPGLLGNRVG